VVRQRDDRIPRRTSEIELWDVNPVGTRDAWRRELLQFWSLVGTRGRRIARRGALGVVDPVTNKGRPLFVDEVAEFLADRIASADGAFVSPHIHQDLSQWLADTIVVPGERSGRRGQLPAAGLSTPSYAALLLFNRTVTRERFWAAFLWNALASDFVAAEVTGQRDHVSLKLDSYLGLGLALPDKPGPRTTWTGIDLKTVAGADPETYLVFRALETPGTDGLGDARTGLGDDALRGSTDGAVMHQLLCPGSVVLMRRSLSLLLERQGKIGHAALSDLVETSLTFHATQYFIRGMRVLNGLSKRRALPDDCRRCWDKFQPDLRPVPTPADRARWQSDGYSGAGTADEARWVERTCQADDFLFVNAGRKEDAAAKDLARVSIERLRRELATYTVNRITLSIARGVCESLGPDLGQPEPPPLDMTLERLDAWSGEVTSRALLAFAWKKRIEQLANDPAIPGPIQESVPDRVADAAGDPAGLEAIVRDLVSEAILSSRAFTRYIELMNSLLGGGALPTNQDPKGMMARGGSRSVPFHLTVNDRALELLVALAALEARDRGATEDIDPLDDPTSFAGFLRFIERRFHLVFDRGPSGEDVPSGLVSAASAESIAALRARLSSMGMLEEYSDSSEWNRISWGTGR
jgi:hypothetical protein